MRAKYLLPGAEEELKLVRCSTPITIESFHEEVG
jgi:hypothetical protein